MNHTASSSIHEIEGDSAISHPPYVVILANLKTIEPLAWTASRTWEPVIAKANIVRIALSGCEEKVPLQ